MSNLRESNVPPEVSRASVNVLGLGAATGIAAPVGIAVIADSLGYVASLELLYGLVGLGAVEIIASMVMNRKRIAHIATHFFDFRT